MDAVALGWRLPRVAPPAPEPAPPVSAATAGAAAAADGDPSAAGSDRAGWEHRARVCVAWSVPLQPLRTASYQMTTH
jgi:hypothetical protein